MIFRFSEYQKSRAGRQTSQPRLTVAQKITPEPVPLSGTVRGKHQRGERCKRSSASQTHGFLMLHFMIKYNHEKLVSG